MNKENESPIDELARILDDRYVRREEHSKTQARVTNLEAELADLRRLITGRRSQP